MKHNWEYKTLGSACIPKKEILRASLKFGKEDTIEYIDISSIHKDSGTVNPTTYTFMDAPSRAQQVVNDNDVLVSLVRPNLKNIALIQDDKDNLVASSGFCVLRGKTLSQRYIYHLVNSKYFTNKLVIKCAGAAYPAVREQDVKDTIVPVPPMEVQKQIVEELDKINEVIENCRELLCNLDALAQSLFYDTFGDPITNPKGWPVKTLGEVGNIERGSGISKKDFVDNGVPCIHYGQLHTSFGPIAKTHISCISDNLIIKPKIAHNGDLIMAITSEDVDGSCKSTAWLGDYDVIVGSDAAILHHKQNGVFLSFYTMTKAFYYEKSKYAKGFKVTHISAKEIASIPIFVPSIQLQEEFAAQVEAIEEQKKAVEATMAELQTLLDSRMDYWFN